MLVNEQWGNKKAIVGFFLLFILAAITLIISYFALPGALKNNYPDVALKLNPNSSSFTIKLTKYISKLIDKKRNPSFQTSSKDINDKKQGAPNNTNKFFENNNELDIIIYKTKNLISIDPLNGELYRLLAQLYDLNGSRDAAQNLISTASDISSREIIAHDSNLRQNLIKNRPILALKYADRLFSSAPELMPNYIPAFNYFIQNENSRESLVDLLERNPHWRSNFFSQVVPISTVGSSSNISTLLASLNKKSTPLTNKELNFFLSSLMNAGKFQIAYQEWIGFLSPEYRKKVKLINNGGFEEEPTGAPFDWLITGGKEARAQFYMTSLGDISRVLNIEFGNGRILFPNVSQIMVLTPGKYSIEGRYIGEAIGKRGLFWNVNCLGGSIIGSSNEIMGRFSNWKKFQFEINVPVSDCGAQRIFLRHGARSPSEQILRGSISFDDIKVTSLQD